MYSVGWMLLKCKVLKFYYYITDHYIFYIYLFREHVESKKSFIIPVEFEFVDISFDL